MPGTVRAGVRMTARSTGRSSSSTEERIRWPKTTPSLMPTVRISPEYPKVRQFCTMFFPRLVFSGETPTTTTRSG
jgi:hypothetical protein